MKTNSKFEDKLIRSNVGDNVARQGATLQTGEDVTGKVRRLFPQKTIYWHDQRRQAGVTFEHKKVLRHYLLEDFGLHEWLHTAYAAAGHGTLSQIKLQEALRSLRSECLYKGELRQSHIRSARIGDVVYIDLGDNRAVRINADGWELTNQSEVLFIRTDDVAPQCEPQHGGDINELREHLNLKSTDDLQLVVAFLVQSLAARSPYPLLSIVGEQGSGKTHTCEKVASLVAPSNAPLKTMPSSDDAFKRIALQNRFCIVDNISLLSGKQADLLCQLSTGIGYTFRPPGSAGEGVPITTSCPIVLNGINNVVTRPDLLERTITIYLEKITPQTRKPLSTLWDSFEKAKPRILGALYEGISAAIRNHPTTVLHETPRMADFAVFASAAQPAYGWDQQSFLDAYGKAAQEAAEDNLRTDPIAIILMESMEGVPSAEYEPAKWVEKLKEYAVKNKTGTILPTNPRVLSESISRLQPMLRTQGLEVTFSRRNGRRYISIVNNDAQDSTDSED